MLQTLKRWARAIRRDAVALWLAARDPRTPWLPRVLALLVAAYALSPVDLIPDFIPVLGYLDEAVLLPLAMLVVVRLLPPDLLADLRHRADALTARPVSRMAAAVIVLVWLAVAGLAGCSVLRAAAPL